MSALDGLKEILNRFIFEPQDQQTLQEIEKAMKLAYPGTYYLRWADDRGSVELVFDDKADEVLWLLQNV